MVPAPRSTRICSTYHFESLVKDLDRFFQTSHKSHIEQAGSFAVMLDAGTDIGGHKLFSVMVRYINQGVPRIIHAGLKDIHGGGTAENQKKLLEEVISEMGLR
ncbi:hypothetical protein BLNAU_5954 [Blattamonas nauphoetae]|uniref:Uncharacterized protein n=1 Tax=Blattamonas nauphoetae TaxID=2049346 RepID=A0ABQ9Y629_9EUKA|nr:hypothetical protein BLNAU_5954 [Blattamonas nauphoetae]